MRTARALLTALALAAPAPAGPPRADPDGFPLPAEAVRRFGSAKFRHPHPVQSFRVRPDGKVVYTTDGYSVYGWDLATGRPKFVTPKVENPYHWRGLGCTATRLRAVAHEGGYVVTDLDPETGQVVGQAKPVYVSQYGSVVLSPDGEWLLRFSEPTKEELAKTPGKGEQLLVSDAAGARPPVDLGRVGSSYSARFARDGTVFTVTGPLTEGQIRAFDPRTGAVLREWSTSGVLLGIHGTADHAFTAWSQKPGELALKSWDAKTGEVRKLFEGSPHAAGHSMAPGDGVLAVQAAPYWHDWLFTDPATGKELGRLPMAGYPYPGPTDGEFAPGGKTFVTHRSGAGGRGHVVTPWEVPTGKPTAAGTYPCEPVTRLRSTADGRLLGMADGQVFSWDAGTGGVRLHGAVLDREGWASSDAWDVRADGIRVARTKWIPTSDHTQVAVADAATGEVRATVRSAFPGRAAAVAFSADGGRLFWAVPNELVVTEWDLAADRAVARRKTAGVARRLRASPDGRWLAGLTSQFGREDEPGQAVVWDLRAADQAPRVIDCPDVAWTELEFTGRGTLTILGCGAKAYTVRTWDLAGGREVWRASVPLPAEFRHGAPVTLSPDGGTLAVPVAPAGSTAYAVQLIELFTGRPRHSFAGHTAAVTSLSFTADGQLASAGQDAPVYLWDVRGELTRPKDPPDRSALDRAWADLGSDDPAVGFRAVRVLAGFPDRSVPFLAERLPTAAEPDPARFAALVADLDAPKFADREKAMKELAGLGRPAERALRQALASAGSAEARSRLENLLARLPKEKTADDRRAARAVEAVGWAGTGPARKLLSKWAAGSAEAPLTAEATRAAQRLTR